MNEDHVVPELQELADAGLKDTPIAPAVGVAAIALSMAMKYHAINTVQDGSLYQQYRLEGRNMQDLTLAHVFDTAMQMEAHLLGASDRIAGMILDALVEGGGAEVQSNNSGEGQADGEGE